MQVPATDSAFPYERVNRMANSQTIVSASSFQFPGGTLVVLAVIAIGAALWVWALIDALRINDQTWAAAGQSKLVWVVVIILLSVLGSILYIAVAKRAIKKVSLSRAAAVEI